MMMADDECDVDNDGEMANDRSSTTSQHRKIVEGKSGVCNTCGTAADILTASLSGANQDKAEDHMTS